MQHLSKNCAEKFYALSQKVHFFHTALPERLKNFLTLERANKRGGRGMMEVLKGKTEGERRSTLEMSLDNLANLEYIAISIA